MAKQKVFNVTGPCIPALHYMVDTSRKIDEIINKFVDAGEYFTINRARQYGKTTTLELLFQRLQTKYVVLDISFEGDDYDADSKLFIENFLLACGDSLRRRQVDSAVIDEWLLNSESTTFAKLGQKITALAAACSSPIILMIDEVDKACDNAVFINFLGLLRKKYIQQQLGKDASFHSVILAGVHDVKNLKMKLRPEEKHSYNSPWNIAARFDVDMSFSAPEIASMLTEYEQDHHTGMDIEAVAGQIHYYTSGYPFLVSVLCKVIHDERLEWSVAGVNEAEKRVVKEKNTLFDDVTKNLINNDSFSNLVKRILLQGAQIAFEDQNPDIDMGLMYGIFAKDSNGFVNVSNIIFETRMYNYYVSVEATSSNFDNVAAEKSLFIRDGRLDVETVLKRFSALMYAEYREENGDYLERHAGLLFLCFLKPIINGTGHYVVEPETRGGRRMDIIVFYGSEEHIIELKIWRGEKYEEKGIEQLAHYLNYRGQKKGYLLSFCDNQTSPREGKTITYNDSEIVEVIIAYRDKE